MNLRRVHFFVGIALLRATCAALYWIPLDGENGSSDLLHKLKKST
jgi:hypothetical protein